MDQLSIETAIDIDIGVSKNIEYRLHINEINNRLAIDYIDN